MKRNAQIKLRSKMFKEKLEFGGSLMKRAKNRHARPISSKESMHVILKSSCAKGKFGFNYGGNPKRIKSLLDRHCAKYAVKLISYSNNFNHLHLHLKFASRALYLKFIRSFTAAVAMAVTGAVKLKSLKSILGTKKFFDFRPFTRVVRGLRNFRILEDYVKLNQLEATGVIPKRDGRLTAIQEHERRYFR